MARYASIIALLAFTTTLASASPTGEVFPLIVGGEEAKVGEFPWMVDIRRPTHTCGASIVNAEWVVTAAHCTQGAVSSYTVVVGDHDITAVEGTEQTRTIERIVNHPSYTPSTFENDISLMKVSQPFQLNARVQPVALPSAHFIPTFNTTAVGWGRLSEGGASPPKLQKVDVPYVTDEVCNQAYSGRIKESMICAGFLGQGGKDACQGDSGGPLMCSTGSTNFLCGIVSWGTGCARPQYPGVYTEVTYFSEWINSVIRSS